MKADGKEADEKEKVGMHRIMEGVQEVGEDRVNWDRLRDTRGRRKSVQAEK